MTLENLMQKIRPSDAVEQPELPDPGSVEVPDDASSLDTGDLLDADPKPGRRRAAEAQASSVRKRRGPARVPEKLTAATKKQVSDILIMMITLPAGALAMRDPVCGGALVAQAEPIAKALVPIIARNPKMLAWFTEGGGWMDYMALLMALQPVGAAVWGHHVTGSRAVHEHGEEVAGGGDYGFTIPDA